MSVKTKIHDLISVELPFALISVTKLKIKQGLYDTPKHGLRGLYRIRTCRPAAI